MITPDEGHDGYSIIDRYSAEMLADVVIRELQRYSEARMLDGTIWGALRDFDDAARKPGHFTND